MQNIKIQKSQGGFTLIELVIVIVILGILAAVAVPRFIDLSDEAEQAAVAGVAGSMASAMAINYAGCSAVEHDATNNPGKCVAISDCENVTNILEGGTPGGYTVSGGPIGGGTNGESASCTVTSDSDAAAIGTFQGIAAGN